MEYVEERGRGIFREMGKGKEGRGKRERGKAVDGRGKREGKGRMGKGERRKGKEGKGEREMEPNLNCLMLMNSLSLSPSIRRTNVSLSVLKLIGVPVLAVLKENEALSARDLGAASFPDSTGEPTLYISIESVIKLKKEIHKQKVKME